MITKQERYDRAAYELRENMDRFRQAITRTGRLDCLEAIKYWEKELAAKRSRTERHDAY